MGNARPATPQTILVQANGLNFAVDQCGKGQNLALFLHGFPESKYSWRDQLPLLAELGYTAWAPDLRGYGAIDCPQVMADYAMPHLIDDVTGLIDAARAAGITGEVTLIAHDWGGAIAWFYVLAPKRPIAAFIVMNLPHPKKLAEGLKTFRQLRKSWYVFFFQIPCLPEFILGRRDARKIGGLFRDMAIDKSRFPDSVLKIYRESAQKPGRLTAMLNYYRARIRFPTKIPTGILKIPTLMIWGEADTALGKELTIGTENLVADFTLRTLPNVSHWVQQEAPERVNELIRDWLRKPKQRSS
jgi:pimeloyl-ACP methyl ester carboxylesterase